MRAPSTEEGEGAKQKRFGEVAVPQQGLSRISEGFSQSSEANCHFYGDRSCKHAISSKERVSGSRQNSFY